MSTFSGSDRQQSGPWTPDQWGPYSRPTDQWTPDGRRTEAVHGFDEQVGEYDTMTSSTQHRLASARAESGRRTSPTKSRRRLSEGLWGRFRFDLILGIGLVLAGVVFVMSSRSSGQNTASTDAFGASSAANSEIPVDVDGSSSSTDVPLLLADEALVAVALDPGSFPPAMKTGDLVQVVVTPTFDGGGEVRILESRPVVHRVDAPGDMESKWIVTLRAPAAVAKAVAASGPVHLSILGSES